MKEVESTTLSPSQADPAAPAIINGRIPQGGGEKQGGGGHVDREAHPPESRASSLTPTRINGRFAKGFSGNPGDLPKELRGIQHLARTHAERMIAVLAEIAENEKATQCRRWAYDASKFTANRKLAWTVEFQPPDSTASRTQRAYTAIACWQEFASSINDD
jgi:hypothetical protein